MIAKILADSITKNGVRLTTFELEYPRFIHSEIMTHRLFSRNAASSRAIPFSKMLGQLNAVPVRFGAANKGMQDKGDAHNGLVLYPEIDDEGDFVYYGEYTPEAAWESAKEFAVAWAQAFERGGYHKQVYNRLLEPFQTMKTVVSATEWNNFFWLRDDGAADPTIQALAKEMKKAREESIPQVLGAGEWHLPYVNVNRDYASNVVEYSIFDEYTREVVLSPEEAIKVSAARCAAVSYRNNDYGLEKCLEVYDRLVGSEKKHASALEHQATPMATATLSFVPDDWQEGTTHVDAQGNLWSGNFRGWIQYRQLVNGHAVAG